MSCLFAYLAGVAFGLQFAIKDRNLVWMCRGLGLMAIGFSMLLRQL